MQESLVKTSKDDKDIISLYNEGLNLVQSTVNNFAYKYRLADKQEFYSHLCEKLIRVINNFDSTKNVPFKYFARKSLSGYGFNYIRDHSRAVKIPRKYSDVYMKYNKLQRENNHSLSQKDAANILGEDIEFMKMAIEAASTRFSPVEKFNSTLICHRSPTMSISYLKNLPQEIYEILEEIFIDNTPEEKVFLSRGLNPAKGRTLINSYLTDIYKLYEI